ncbi:beta-1,4-galactosyltransferase 2 isoform X2 [Callorhinchus milii]|uniref:beta-1,4-galactosyltransferase 2 isoform X2 n=1 Tax=Callorhinchus milii TaxID=7868 RepID=UPI0004571CE0|nr:beta-1,4-galactosyltransferase 2 isoform X2 [Callorhinchus milii]|eukprot:gi/632963873/ref/XP_007898123.1/ PREDICTED: beta-1,4-galactosyltransferase 2 isoform X2 [Callorhinchus milii]
MSRFAGFTCAEMSRLMLGKTLERICKAVLLLCLVHFLIMMILYLDVYTQRFDIFSRFNNRNYSKIHQYFNSTKPNRTFLGGEDHLMSSRKLESNLTVTEKPLSMCPDVPQGLVGRLLIEFNSPMTMQKVQRENPDVKDGGKYTPSDCKAKQKVAIIIPFRHREHHLKYWLHYLHPILRRQKINYGIYVINQNGESMFNRAKLLNIGYTEALKDGEYDCFVFSDVDLIPMDDRNVYHCYDQPRHFAIAMDKFGFRLPYTGYFGGVSGLSKEQFLKINGFPNEYWGWGGEDDDIYNRFTKIQNTKINMLRDGINSLKYQLLNVSRFPLYTNITVDIGTPPHRPPRG